LTKFSTFWTLIETIALYYQVRLLGEHLRAGPWGQHTLSGNTLVTILCHSCNTPVTLRMLPASRSTNTASQGNSTHQNSITQHWDTIAQHISPQTIGAADEVLVRKVWHSRNTHVTLV
jgi:hypothetical protein